MRVRLKLGCTPTMDIVLSLGKQANIVDITVAISSCLSCIIDKVLLMSSVRIVKRTDNNALWLMALYR